MTVAVACNLSEGVVLAVDSAVTIEDGGNIYKVYENAQKLFGLGDRPIGIAVYGLGALGARSIGSYINEFENIDPGGVLTAQSTVADISEQLRDFLLGAYMREVAPRIAAKAGVPFDQVPPDQRPVLGLVVGGFSHGAFLPEVWEITIPVHDTPGSAAQKRGQGDFGTNWFAMLGPIRRYLKGYEPDLVTQLLDYFATKRGTPLTPQELLEVGALLESHEYSIPFSAMPITEGVLHARFLAELVVNHHRFAVGAPIVGGQVRVGMVTYRGSRFQIFDDQL